MLKPWMDSTKIEAGCDEAGRGCMAGPVCAAAVILNNNLPIEGLNDSKKLTEKQRIILAAEIKTKAVAWAVAFVDNNTIDKMNILNASIHAMHLALEKLHSPFDIILVDGNRFHPYKKTPHQCIIKGDGIYQSIAAASILAKTSRDELMESLHLQYPVYGWNKNKGYATKAHINAMISEGRSPYHRDSFHLHRQLKLKF